TSGVGAGARTGFASVVTAGFFLLALFFSPLLNVVTPEVTAPALIIVGVMMSSSFKNIQWEQFEIAVPAFLTIIMMPLAGTMATGIAVAFDSYQITMLSQGRGRDIHPVMLRSLAPATTSSNIPERNRTSAISDDTATIRRTTEVHRR